MQQYEAQPLVLDTCAQVRGIPSRELMRDARMAAWRGRADGCCGDTGPKGCSLEAAAPGHRENIFPVGRERGELCLVLVPGFSAKPARERVGSSLLGVLSLPCSAGCPGSLVA